MAKKPKNPLKKGSSSKDSKSNEGNCSTIFKTLFGEIPESNSAENSLFSDSNPFRRKLLETREPNHDSGLGIQAKDDRHHGNAGCSDLSELKKEKKRTNGEEKQESSGLEPKSVSEKIKKLKWAELKENEGDDKSNMDIETKEIPETEVAYSPENDKSNKKKKKKRKRDEVEAEYEAKRYGLTDEVKENKEENSVLGEKRKKMDNAEDMMVSKEGFDDESKLLRTVFVGNLPLKFKKKEIMKEFGKFGEVESVRIRSVPIVDGKIPRKGAVITKKFNENVDSVNAYVVFKTEEFAQSSLAHNMAVVGGNHIRVDRACPPRKKLKGDGTTLYDNKRTVFVGNLPFDVKDEEIYKLFCGVKNLETSVEAVRVIRDPGSSLGKGIAYVLFKTMDAANLLLKKRNLKLRDRELRLSHAKSIDTPSKKRTNSSQSDTNSNPSKKLRTPDNMKTKADLSYQGLHASKSGAQKKVHTKINFSAKSKSQPPAEVRSRKGKRPSVAARKEKALFAAAKGTQAPGVKRKFGNRTPENSGQKKKARKFR